jgi:conflict system pore-forming effector with SLATT domain
MAGPHEPPRFAPHTVASIEQAVAARRGTKAPNGSGGPEARAADQLLSAMRTVKAARFNAAERLERKHTLSLFAMSMVSLYFVGLSVWQAIYAAELSEASSRLITLVSIMSSIFTLVLALIESMNDYRTKAHHMHTCALGVNDLYHELKLMRPVDAVHVQDFRRRYNDVVRSCPFNHARVDYLMARAERGVGWEEKAWAWLRYAGDVYVLHGFCLIAPPLVLLLGR